MLSTPNAVYVVGESSMLSIPDTLYSLGDERQFSYQTLYSSEVTREHCPLQILYAL